MEKDIIKKLKVNCMDNTEVLENYGFEKRFNRITGELELYVFKISKSYFIKIDIKTGELKINGFLNTSKGIDLIMKLHELLTNKIIFVDSYMEE